MDADRPTPLPWGRVLVLCALLLVNSLSLVMIFPMLPFMVLKFFPDLPPEKLGYRAGIMASAFNVGAFFGSIAWGVFSDRFGRRPALLLGVIGTVGCVLAFGFSTNFTMAVTARLLWGLLNGNVGVAKTYLSEICDDSNQAKAYAAIGLSSSTGRLIGPILGGFLSQPAQQYPSVFGNNQFANSYPFALPSLIAACFCIISFVMGMIYLQETLVRTHSNSDLKKGLLVKNSTRNQIFNKDTLLCIGLYAFVAFSTIMAEEIFPLWALLSPSDGGLGFKSGDIGLLLTLSAPFQLLSQAFLYDRLASKLGMMKLFRSSILITSLAFALIPYTTSLVSSKAALWTVLLMLFSFMMVFRIFAFTTVFVFVGNTCLSEFRGRVNGVGQATAAVTRAIGPTVAGSIFAWSASNSLSWPVDQTLSFSFQILFGFISWLIAMQLPSTVEKQMKQPKSHVQVENSDEETLLLEPENEERNTESLDHTNQTQSKV